MNVLIVDDVVNNRFFINRLCQQVEGVKTFEASNGMEAIQYLEEDDSIELVFMDIEMPMMDGIDATRVIKERWPEIEVVFQTACYLYKNVDRINQIGKFEVLEKPIMKDDVHRIISKRIEEKEAH
jgi:CheY-like chemotaxis protein